MDKLAGQLPHIQIFKELIIGFCSFDSARFGQISIFFAKIKIMDAKSQMLEHSKAKVKLYARYLSIFLNIIQRDGFTKKIYLYDVFCGEGEYDDGSRGSPLIALDMIKKHFYENKKKIKPIKIIFNDNDSEKIEKLRDLVKNYFKPNNCCIDIENEDYTNLIKNVIDEIKQFKNDKGLIFIDPYGYKIIKISDIQKLLSGNKTEVILFLPISFMYRFAKATIYEDHPGYEPLKKFMEEVFRLEIPDFRSVYDFIIQLRTAFQDKLGEYYIDTFILERDLTNIYCLFFFTSHIRGFEKMLEAKWRIDKQEGRGFKLDKQGRLFTFRELDDFPRKLRAYIKSKTPCTNKDLYKFGLLHGYLPKHMREILCKFQEEELLLVSSENQEKIKKRVFYLDYNNHSPYEKQIVYFKIVKD